MSNKISNLALLQRIIRELKTENEDTYFWNKISTDTWNDIIKNKLFKEKCSKINGHAMKTLQGYSEDYTINYLQHEENEDSAQDRDQRDKFQPIFDCITKTLDLPLYAWKDGIEEETILKLIEKFKKMFIAPKPSNNPYGNTANTGGSEALLLDWIIKEIIDQGFLGVHAWATIVHKITSKNYDTNEKQTIGSWNARVKKYYKENKTSQVGISSIYYYILKDIADELEFDMKYWGDVSSLDLDKHINIFREKYLQRLKLNLGTFDKYVQKSKLRKEEREILSFLKETSSLRDVLDFFDTPSINKTFQKSPSDRFLKESIVMLYDRGAYALINDRILPEISDKFLITPEMKLFRAHIYGSEQVKRYMKAIKTLDSIEDSEMEKFADNKTALISNILRHELGDIDENTKIKDLEPIFEETTDMYCAIFTKHPHYYPGINYAYMLDIGLHLFPDSKIFNDDSVKDLFVDSQHSIDEEKASDNTFERYYATISEAEFKALLGTFDRSSLHKELVDINPSQDTLVRTIRQLRFYENTLSKIDTKPKQSMQDLKDFLVEFLGVES